MMWASVKWESKEPGVGPVPFIKLRARGCTEQWTVLGSSGGWRPLMVIMRGSVALVKVTQLIQLFGGWYALWSDRCDASPSSLLISLYSFTCP